MKLRNWLKWHSLVLIAVFSGSMCSFGFSMLGPWTDWMNLSAGYQQPGDIGGPMNLGEGYRWNMPVVTYGFDRSFLDYFGTNGVAAVEAAIGMLNALPPVSSLVLSNCPVTVWKPNYMAQALNLYDLKSATAVLLLEQMGLTDPTRYMFCVRDYYQAPGSSDYTFDVIMRNFDPTTARPSSYVNGDLDTYIVHLYAPSPTFPTNRFCDTFVLPVNDVLPPQHVPATSGQMVSAAYFLTGLSQDDVGGLRYLLSGSQLWCENLPPDVQAVGTNSGSLVRTAVRPGIEKVSFVRHPYGALNGEFKPFTNIWTDVYFDWDLPVYQDVERITTRPDILFTGQDLGPGVTVIRSGTTNWANNAELNGNSGGAGPGVIQPPITITFNTVGLFYVNSFPDYMDELTAYVGYSWGSFDGSTNVPILYPNTQNSFQPTQVNFRLLLGGMTNDFHWSIGGGAYGRFYFQTATNLNLTDWITLTTLTNSGQPFSYEFQAATDDSSRFFRTIQQQ